VLGLFFFRAPRISVPIGDISVLFTAVTELFFHTTARSAAFFFPIEFADLFGLSSCRSLPEPAPLLPK